ncbi:hypothetical protein C3L33_04482, partial [Rhododendron williamsianum]
MATTDPDHRDAEEATAGEDEDTGAQVAPLVKLQEVAVTTGEEEEDAILDLYSLSLSHAHTSISRVSVLHAVATTLRFDFVSFLWTIFVRKAKLYRFDKEGNQWKERGVGTVKLLKHKENGKVLGPTMSVQEYAGNDKACVWHAADFSDGERKDEFFCI